MTAVQAQFELSRAEGISALRWGVTRRGVRYLATLGAVLVAAGGGLLITSAVAGWGLIAVGVLELLVAAWVYWVLPVRTWRARMSAMGTTTYLFSPDEIEMNALGNHSSMSWSRLEKIMELPDLYILQMSGTTGRLPIPKRAFSSNADQEEFRRLAAEHCSVELRR